MDASLFCVGSRAYISRTLLTFFTYIYNINFGICEKRSYILRWESLWLASRDPAACICRQQMQQGGPSSPSCASSSSDRFPLRHLGAAQCGSETSAEPEKREVRVKNIVSIRQSLISG